MPAGPSRHGRSELTDSIRGAARVGMRAYSGYRAGRAAKAARGAACARNSFDAQTGVVMADGSQVPISQVQAGDLVWAADPVTGRSSAQPVVSVITGTGSKHLIDVVTRDEAGTVASLRATAGHEIWVESRGWTRVDELTVGDQLRGATGGVRTVQAMHDHGWLSGQTVYNLTVAGSHTYHVGDHATLVHNCVGTKFNLPARPGVYNIKFKDGSRYIGMSVNMRRRVNRHFTKGGKFAGQAATVKKASYKRHSVFTMRREEKALIRGYEKAGRWGMSVRGEAYRTGKKQLRNKLR